MTEERYIEICIEDGFTEEEARFLLRGKPDFIDLADISEEAIRYCNKKHLPAFKQMRASLDYHE